jgi:hypothetical protein
VAADVGTVELLSQWTVKEAVDSPLPSTHKYTACVSPVYNLHAINAFPMRFATKCICFRSSEITTSSNYTSVCIRTSVSKCFAFQLHVMMAKRL